MSPAGALAALKRLESAAVSNAAPMPSRRDRQPEWQGLGFQVGGVRLVSAFGEISEVMTLPRVTAIPNVRKWLLGISSVRGRLLPIIDLHTYLSMTPTQPASEWRVLVVEDGDLVAGLLVEQSLGMQHFTEAPLEARATEQLGDMGRYVDRVFRRGGHVYFEARIRNILRDDKFMNVAEAHI